jgi:hypothetical protein
MDQLQTQTISVVSHTAISTIIGNVTNTNLQVVIFLENACFA